MELESCYFCSLPSKRIILETELSMVIRDSFPVSEGHTLIITKRHIESIFDATKEEQIGLLANLEEAKKILDNKFSPDGYNVGINDGKAAGQTVMHLHTHLIPRYSGDSEQAKGGVRWIFPDKANYWSQI
jgi:diadenosine tetraphosphate (Ap4A) HIT family hydrolase